MTKCNNGSATAGKQGPVGQQPRNYKGNTYPSPQQKPAAQTPDATSTTPIASTTYKCRADFRVPFRQDEHVLVYPAFLVKGFIEEIYGKDSTSTLRTLDLTGELQSIADYPTDQRNFAKYFEVQQGTKSKTSAPIHAVFHIRSALTFTEFKRRTIDYV